MSQSASLCQAEVHGPVRRATAPGQASGIAYEAGLRALLRGMSSVELGGINRIVASLRQQSFPIDHFLNMPETELRLVQPDAFSRARPISGRTATVTVADLLNIQEQTVSPTSDRWTIADETAVRQSIQDAVQVLRGAMGHNAHVGAICQTLNGAITTSVMTAGAAAVGGVGWLSATLPNAPDADQLQGIALQSDQSPYHVPLENDFSDDPGDVLRQPFFEANRLPKAENRKAQSGYLPFSFRTPLSVSAQRHRFLPLAMLRGRVCCRRSNHCPQNRFRYRITTFK